MTLGFLPATLLPGLHVSSSGLTPVNYSHVLLIFAGELLNNSGGNGGGSNQDNPAADAIIVRV